jgi:hypothetical protein
MVKRKSHCCFMYYSVLIMVTSAEKIIITLPDVVRVTLGAFRDKWVVLCMGLCAHMPVPAIAFLYYSFNSVLLNPVRHVCMYDGGWYSQF